jgi:peptide/nickel transport system ATP-binding protein
VTEPHAGLWVAGLRVCFGPSVVLESVDLTVPAGQVVVLLGESGSGKSTLLRALLGLVPEPGRVDAGRMEVVGPTATVGLLGRTAAGWRAVRGTLIGAVFQDSALALTPLRTVGSLLVEAAGCRLPVDEQAARLAACGFADPAPVLAARCAELSGGMAQRVGMALATARSPAVLLADEPTTALDGPSRAEVIARLRHFAAGGGAVLMTTHDVASAAIADRVVVLEHGRVAETGATRDVLGSPAKASTRRLVAQAPWSLAVPPPREIDRSSPPALAVERLVKRFAHPVLRGVDLVVSPGELVGVAGVSGAGKSTLVRCLMGLEQPDAGMIRVGDVDPRHQGWKALRRRAQLVPQDPRASLNPWRTAVQAVAEPLRYHRIGSPSDRRRRAEELLEAVGLGALGARYPAELSTGQCQRVAIARALAVAPSVVVADEPVSALDTHTQAEIVALLRRMVVGTATAALVVSHDLHVLERLCDRITVLDEGRIVSDQSPRELREEPAHPTTSALVACYPTDPLETLRSFA